MIRSYKTEIEPLSSQIVKINQTIGTCRFIYNFYIQYNKEQYALGNKFVNGFDFSKYLNNQFIPNNSDFKWIKEVSSKAVKQSIMNAEKAFNNFFQKGKGFPKFKKKNKSNIKIYLPKNNTTDLTVERHKIKIPTLGWVNLKEKGYIPTGADVKSCTIENKAGRYYISVKVETNSTKRYIHNSEGLGIDLGIKTFATVSNGMIFPSIRKEDRVRKLLKKIKSSQRKLSRKLKNKKGGNATTANIDKTRLRLQIAHQKLTNKKSDYYNKIIASLVKTKPEFITIEDLNVSGMMKNRCLSKAIAFQNFYGFRNKLKSKSGSFELRIADRFYPSSKTCSKCGNIKKKLGLEERVYNCEICGNTIDRDLNAAINLEKLEVYKVETL